jgi:signal transduction histidine kinase
VMRPVREDLERTLDKVVESEREAVARESAVSARAVARSMAWVLTTGLGGLLLSVALGLTVFRRLAQQFRREEAARQEAIRAAAARQEILAVVSHDLRSPLGAILIGASLLERGIAPDSKARRQLDAVSSAAHRMKHLIEEVLDNARLESGSFVLRRSPQDLRTLLEETRGLYESRATQGNVRLSADVAGEPLRAEVDRERLLQVFENLVGNALKFTPPGGEIRLKAAATPEGIQISVQDTGPGMSSAELEHVFDRHWQSPDRPRKDGLGLGLYIARTIVELHGGRIWAQSTPDVGTTFSLVLPDASVRADPRPPEDPPSTSAIPLPR